MTGYTPLMIYCSNEKVDAQVIVLFLAQGAEVELGGKKILNELILENSKNEEAIEVLENFEKKESVWSLDSHRFFKSDFKKLVETFLICNKIIFAFSNLRHLKIPKYILFKIIFFFSTRSPPSNPSKEKKRNLKLENILSKKKRKK